MTGIEWTNHTWNVFAGCTKVSPGCKHCYAITDAVRMGTRIEKYDGVAKEVGPHKYNWTGRLNFDPKVLREPYDLRFPSRIFVNSMSDMFHEDAKFGVFRESCG
jgi:protein gp37